MNDAAPVSVIPYAPPSTGSPFDRSGLARPARRFGFVGLAITGFYLPGWLGGRVIFGHYFSGATYGLETRTTQQLIPVAQAALIGAGLALTLAARQKGYSAGARWKYLLALSFNVLGAASLILQVSGVLEGNAWVY
jgi:hypothetical protein